MTFPPFCHHAAPGHLWFRIFGWGLAVKDIRCWPLLFSERMGKTGRSFGRWHIMPLRPE